MQVHIKQLLYSHLVTMLVLPIGFFVLGGLA